MTESHPSPGAHQMLLCHEVEQQQGRMSCSSAQALVWSLCCCLAAGEALARVRLAGWEMLHVLSQRAVNLLVHALHFIFHCLLCWLPWQPSPGLGDEMK